MSRTTPITPAYLWFDTEYTDCDLGRARLLQVALIVTDVRLRRLLPAARDLGLNLRLPPGAPVSPWVKKHQAALLAACRSDAAASLREADRRLCACVDDALGPPRRRIAARPVLAGNSVYCDWVLANRFLPGFAARLHYRLLDVTAFKLQWLDVRRGKEFDDADTGLVSRYLPGGYGDASGRPHDAVYDILASMAEFSFYRRHLLAPGTRAAAASPPKKTKRRGEKSRHAAIL